MILWLDLYTNPVIKTMEDVEIIRFENVLIYELVDASRIFNWEVL